MLKLLIASCLFVVVLSLGSMQSVAVKGKLLCNGEPMNQVKVKLYDKDPLSDDLMGEGHSDERGVVQLRGKHQELGKIDPKLNIYHKCNYQSGIRDVVKNCFYKVSLTIPDSYISEGPDAEREFDFGTYNLEAKIGGQSKDCFN